MIIWLCVTVPMGPFKNDVTKKSAYFKLHPLCHSLSLIFQTFSPPLPPYHRPKSDKVFPDKPYAKVHSGFITPKSHFQTGKYKK